VSADAGAATSATAIIPEIANFLSILFSPMFVNPCTQRNAYIILL
jgi:hypothetical protein